MSHFAVLVIGNDPEALLEPFSEHIEVPEYKRENVSEEDMQRFIELYTTEQNKDHIKISAEEAQANKLLSFDELYEKNGEDWNDSAWKKDDEGVWGEFTTYNPNSKWDWYLLGGRWSGFFKVKRVADIVDSMENVKFPEYTVGEAGLMTEEPKIGYADQLLKKDIDFVGMRAEAILKAEKDYDEFHAVLKGREFPLWSAILEKYPEDQIDAARKEFNNLETLKDLSKAGYHWNIKQYNVTREDFLRKASNEAFTTFAFLDEKGWFERGNMGWFGLVSNEKDTDKWYEEFNKMLDALPDDTMLSLYDCHI